MIYFTVIFLDTVCAHRRRTAGRTHRGLQAEFANGSLSFFVSLLCMKTNSPSITLPPSTTLGLAQGRFVFRFRFWVKRIQHSSTRCGPCLGSCSYAGAMRDRYRVGAPGGMLNRSTPRRLRRSYPQDEKKETNQPTQGRDGRTARRHHTGILRRGVWC